MGPAPALGAWWFSRRDNGSSVDGELVGSSLGRLGNDVSEGWAARFLDFVKRLGVKREMFSIVDCKKGAKVGSVF